MHVVTAGYPFMDIDAYAAAIAMAELLRLQGEEAIAASSAPLNGSVPESLRALDVQFEHGYKPSPDDIYTIVDLSDPKYFDLQATPEKIVAIIDHHPGFQDFWQEKLGDQAHIEFIGAACTQVYELWQKAGLFNKMSQNSAKLLACGILDNTLNLKAVITTDRDKTAYANLADHAELPADWPKQYFEECEAYIIANTEVALDNDTKPVQYPSLPYIVTVGQLTLWNAQDFMNAGKQTVRTKLAARGHVWCMNLIDIHSGHSVFYCEDEGVKNWIAETLGVTFEGDVATANRMWLRKEIMQRAIERGGQYESNQI